MGITTDEFFENIYSVVFSPKSFFEREDIKISTRLALATITFVAAVNTLASGIFNGNIHSIFYIFIFLWNIILTVAVWFLTALFFEYTAKIFDKGGKLDKLLFFTAFAPIPYLFFAPLNLLKGIGETGYIFAVLIEVCLYFWIITLYAFSLGGTYNISFSRSFMLIFLPFIASFFAVYQIVCFFCKICYIFSV